MKRLLLLFLLVAGCKGETTDPASAQLRLVRRPADRVALEVSGSAMTPRALQVELVIEGGATIEDPQPPAGVPLDSVRAAMVGVDRARLFAGDKRGIKLSQDGEIASFAVRGSDATIRIDTALLVDDAGNTVPLILGGSLVLR